MVVIDIALAQENDCEFLRFIKSEHDRIQLYVTYEGNPNDAPIKASLEIAQKYVQGNKKIKIIPRVPFDFAATSSSQLVPVLTSSTKHAAGASRFSEMDSDAQVIKNEDLEELKELGSDTFGTVYHGKWRGTDVAIKRIKKSCFTGRSSEQERLDLRKKLARMEYGGGIVGDGGVFGTMLVRWWIGPRASQGPSTLVKERLVVDVGYLKEYTKNSSNNVLIHIWVPVLRRRSAIQYLQQDSSSSVPIYVNPNMNVHNEYPRHQQQQQQYGSLLAFPVFERGSGTCLGVIEFVIANQNLINYRPQLDHLSNALEAVDFRSSHNMNIPPAVKVFEELYEAAVNEIVEVLASVCKTHNLPLALTWAPCIQQQGGGKGTTGGGGCSVSITVPTDQMNNNNHMMMSCISTVDSACYVGDMEMLRFQDQMQMVEEDKDIEMLPKQK
ncbi:uncharacterized protein LOC131598407 [Vicia villosa]|uniref:uncharacterized protein LOC131598407 n=1 Tax=Vicia villosa TaxID=3911 RepID=UPI00273B3A1C|nr:uncharacterized protein LOC131598407 [Vicia villosa]